MSDWFLLYLLTRADGLSLLVAFIAVLCGVVGVGLLAVWYNVSEEDQKAGKLTQPEGVKELLFARGKKLLVCAALLVALCTAMPSRNDIIFIVGGSKLMEMARSPEAAKIGSNALSVVNKYLEDAAKDGAK